jgi:predicted pyridoxine 5'-phosphate oxidase superfamily flavin-nucleotide-binding protein
MTGSTGFHEGELAVQRRAGVSTQAQRLAGMLDPPLIEGRMAEFLAERDMVMLTSRDESGRLWTSALFAEPGFVRAHLATLTVAATPEPGDPLCGLVAGQPIALIAVDFAKRRRLRINGTLVGVGEEGLIVEADQAYGNCPSYIQQRRLEYASDTGSDAGDEPGERARGSVERGSSFTREHVALIEGADTFILGTTHPERGVDASHRGGAPGFVRVENGQLWWPDYSGNNLFNSLGNISVDPCAAMLFFDFERGEILHVSGRARLDWLVPGSPGDDDCTGRRVCFTPNWTVLRRDLPLRMLDFRAFPRNPVLTAR